MAGRIEHRANVLAHEVDPQDRYRSSSGFGHRDRPVGHGQRIRDVDVRPARCGEDPLELRVHVEVRDDAGVLLLEELGEPGDERRVRPQERSLSLGKRAFRNEGVGGDA